MKARFLRVRAIALASASLVAAGVAVAACSTHAKLAGLKEQCFAATDCQDGLFCGPLPDGRSVCTNDPSQYVNTEDAAPPPREAAPPDGARDAPDAAPPADAPAPDTATQPDSASPDATD